MNREEFLARAMQGRQKPLEYLVNNFGKYADVEPMRRFMARHELFKKILDVKGSIVECGVHSGSGLMQWFQLSNVLEPNNHFRIIYGFDTFAGFPAVSHNDPFAHQGDIADDSYNDLTWCAQAAHYAFVHKVNDNEFVQRFPWPRINLIKGNFLDTADKWIEDNKHVVIALLFLDFDLYEPTNKALQVLLPRMPKGAILAFDELNNHRWPGETLAVMEELGLRNCELKQFPWEMNISYMVL